MAHDNRIRVDLHVHTHASPDSQNAPAQILARMDALGLDMVAITDHNTIAGALEMQSIAPTRTIIGQEIKTTRGEIVAYLIREPVPAALTPSQTIELIREQGGIVGVSHPLDAIRSEVLDKEVLLSILSQVDTLETFNARCLLRRFNRQAAELARVHNLPCTAGSDAHTILELGAAYVEMAPFTDARSFLDSLRGGRIVGHLSPVYVHAFSKLAKWRGKLSKRSGD